ncbi:uncharacterized protein LOC132286554 [Cornus florida]|uniref:uncharacterized protein LOC132286554 n=1 Tax=Cornus florida TaxID=4283 RepID=UPI0028A1EED7|nr:uncharacterized protein LOC132286554 [Cornus florida]
MLEPIIGPSPILSLYPFFFSFCLPILSISTFVLSQLNFSHHFPPILFPHHLRSLFNLQFKNSSLHLSSVQESSSPLLWLFDIAHHVFLKFPEPTLHSIMAPRTAPKRARSSQEVFIPNWSEWPIEFETKFAIRDDFKRHLKTVWEVKILKNCGLSSLFKPCHHVVHPPLVHLFYHNILYNCETPTVLTTSNDGTILTFTLYDVAAACGYPTNSPLDANGQPLYGLLLDMVVYWMI